MSCASLQGLDLLYGISCKVKDVTVQIAVLRDNGQSTVCTGLPAAMMRASSTVHDCRHVVTFTFRCTMPGEKAWVIAMGASTFSFKHLSQSVMLPAPPVHNDPLENTQACSCYGQVCMPHFKSRSHRVMIDYKLTRS